MSKKTNQVEDAIASEVFEPIENTIAEIEKASIDIQIATAHQYPRSITLFKERAIEMVTLDEETAQSCIYRRPVGKKGGKTEYAEGKSVRMAEIVGACYGNIRVASMVIEQTERMVKARGMAHDLESNYAASSEVIESTVTKDGYPYSERMRIVVAKAALAKARRDAIFQVVPGALCKTLEDQARKTAIGTIATLDERRKTVLDWINKAGIEAIRIWASLGIEGIEDVGLKELETLTGIKTAIQDGDISLEEAFPVKPITMPKPVTNSPHPGPVGEDGYPDVAGEPKPASENQLKELAFYLTSKQYAECKGIEKKEFDDFMASEKKSFGEAKGWIEFWKGFEKK